MKKLLLLLILPLTLFCASEEDTCYMPFNVPHVAAFNVDFLFQYCIDGYSYIVYRDTITQSFIRDNGKTVPATCSCEVMKIITEKDKE